MPVYLTPPPSGPLTRILATLLGGALLVGAFMLGLVFLSVLLGIALVLGLAAWLRSWWLGRGQNVEVDRQPRASKEKESIEAEFTVVSREQRKP